MTRGAYDYEEAFNLPLEQAQDKDIERLLHAGKLKSVYATKTIKSGDQFEIEIFPDFTKKQAHDLKLKKPSRQAQKNLNDKNARKKLERLINANFSEGDYWITLTYSNASLPKDMQEALKNMRNFIRRINYRRKKEGLPEAKYIYVTEWSMGKGKKIRCHHHMIMDHDLPMDVVESLWKCGKRNNIRRCDPDECGLTGIAKYISKDPKGSKRWCSSKNLKKPVEHKSYTRFKASHVKKIVRNRDNAKTLAEKRYPNKEYLKDEVYYNEINGYFYIYIRMRERRRKNE